MTLEPMNLEESVAFFLWKHYYGINRPVSHDDEEIEQWVKNVKENVKESYRERARWLLAMTPLADYEKRMGEIRITADEANLKSDHSSYVKYLTWRISHIAKGRKYEPTPPPVAKDATVDPIPDDYYMIACANPPGFIKGEISIGIKEFEGGLDEHIDTTVKEIYETMKAKDATVESHDYVGKYLCHDPATFKNDPLADLTARVERLEASSNVDHNIILRYLEGKR